MQVESTSKPMLTVDEANEDTISAFEKNDGAVDLRIKTEQRMSRHRLRGILCAKEISSA